MQSEKKRNMVWNVSKHFSEKMLIFSMGENISTLFPANRLYHSCNLNKDRAAHLSPWNQKSLKSRKWKKYEEVILNH